MRFEEAMQEAHAWLDEHAWVHGVAEGERDGRRTITVFVSDAHAAEALPRELGGHEVVIDVTDEFTAQ